jgi:hypothetical protein
MVSTSSAESERRTRAQPSTRVSSGEGWGIENMSVNIVEF